MKIVSKHSLLRGTGLLVLATAGLYGCKDFLSNASQPQGTLNQGTLATRDGVEGSLIATYRDLDCTNSLPRDGWGCAASNWVWGDVASDDTYKGSDHLDQSDINDVEAYHWSAPGAMGYLEDKWVQAYEGVVRANSTLRLLNEVKGSNPSEFSVADANGIEGEAIFLRAHYHFEAWRMWGNIPYYREDDTDFRKPNEDSSAVAADLLKDLDSAIKLLPATPRNGQKGRATSWTAKAYKGRVEMYNHQYTDAVATFKDIVANGPYALQANVADVWTAIFSKENGPETIFAYQASANDGEPNAANANEGERLNFPYAPSHFQCCGFNDPTQNLVNAFKVDANGLPLQLSDPTWNDSDAEFVAGNMTPVDPRLDWTVGRDGVPYKDWELYSNTWARDKSNAGPYSPKKNIHEKASGAETTVGWQPQQQSSMNIHLFRYADLLLMLAEAEVKTGDRAGAMALVNQVRARAAVAAQGCGNGSSNVATKYPQCAGDNRMAVPINDPSITWAKYDVRPYPSFPDDAYALKAIQIERRLELAMEGQRFFDLRRYGMDVAKQAINVDYLPKEKVRRAYLTDAEPLTDRHRWYAIPAAEIELSKVGGEAQIKQNAGW
ncbi:MAG TPA: RagB/SusD family nutrient uptake outer membrane protein [Gemmatimonadaceae bacterium]|nr:RagB/SusD family nutrient uptake outer membrane protein [Gemmatimonadaceae bacterium]